MSAIRVLLVDDDPLVRTGLRMMLDGADTLTIVAEADDGRQALAAIDRHHPDVVLMDLRMPDLDGIAATRLIRRQPRPPAILVLTTFDTDELVLQALRAGASGFLLKATPPADLVRAIEHVHAGDATLSPTITRQLITLLAATDDTTGSRGDARRSLAGLTDREREVAAAVAQGRTNADIATHLHMSLATVKSHISRLLTKLNLDNRVQLALLVQQADTDSI